MLDRVYSKVKSEVRHRRVAARAVGKAVEQNCSRAFADYTPAPSDVIVCSFFKSGTTWLLQMTTQIAYRGQAEFDNIHHAVPWPDVPMPVLARRMIPVSDRRRPPIRRPGLG